MEKPLSIQHGGDHYKKLAIQPFHFSLQNGWDGAAHSVLKYVTRYRDKGGALDLQKGLHIAEIRRELWGPWLIPSQKKQLRMTMGTYLEANRITGEDARVLTCLEGWVDDNSRADLYETMVNELKLMIESYPHHKG